MTEKIRLTSDYMEGCHPSILKTLEETNFVKQSGYGTDGICEAAREKIRKACGCPGADVWFISGGTQANSSVISSALRTCEAVLAADSGHINMHEAGAIELGGHKVILLPGCDGKLSAAQVAAYMDNFKNDANRDHTVQPAMVYVSQPTEYGTIYSKAELTEISKVCKENGLSLYLDGARLAYALASSENDLTLEDIASLCDAFYIGGTKCGALLGEAIVIPKPAFIPHFFTAMKQRGAVLAKGWIMGIQFDCLFTDGLYLSIGKSAIDLALKLKKAFADKGYSLASSSPTNQVFVALTKEQHERLSETAEFSFWENLSDGRTVVRIATSWATTEEEIDRLISLL